MRFSFRRRPPEPVRHLIVGLGNPGPEYRSTRHNVGFRVLDLLGERHRIRIQQFERRALVGYGSIDQVRVGLVQPQTYMNLSGESVAPLLRQHNLQPADLIVVVDEVNLPVGRVRVRPEGSAGGHNGLKSLIQHLRTDAFPRVRLGVGGPPQGGDLVQHVLSGFGRDDQEPLARGLDEAADAVECILAEGLEAAMNRFNPAR
jgi:peptidyl-tRNA hydrolase, PTH1 family